jgi:fructokinase
MQDWGMDEAGLQTDSTRPTGMVRIKLEAGEPTFDIIPDRAYDGIDADGLPPLAPNPLLYHGSLAARSPTSRAALARIKERLAPRAFVDVNLRPPWWKKDEVLALIEGASWVKINGDELAALVDESGDRMRQTAILQDRFGLDTLYVTEGSAGAFARTRAGEILRVNPEGEVEVVDAVGAGDAFASVLILGLLREWPLRESLERAQAFASAMVGQRGATVRDRAFYRSFAEAWQL